MYYSYICDYTDRKKQSTSKQLIRHSSTANVPLFSLFPFLIFTCEMVFIAQFLTQKISFQ